MAAIDASLAFGTGSGSSQTRAFTVGTGSNRLLVVSTLKQSSQTCSGVTFNGVAMTKIDATTVNGAEENAFWYLLNPDSGEHDIIASFTGSGTSGIAAASYTGFSQEAPEDHGVSYSSFVTTVEKALTTVSAGSWLLGWARCQNDMTAGTNTYFRSAATGNTIIVDTNGASDATKKLIITQTQGYGAMFAASFKVSSGSASSSNSPSISPSSSASPSSSNSPSVSPSSSNSPSASPSTSSSASSSASSSNSSSQSPSSSASSSNSPSVSSSVSPSESSSNSASLSPSSSASSSASPSNSSSNSPSQSPSSSASSSASASPSIGTPFWYNASSLSQVVGSIVSGTLSDTYADDENRLILAEVVGSPGFDYVFTFGENDPIPYTDIYVCIKGFYQGNPAHNVKIQQYNYTGASWTNLTVNANDFPSDSTDQTYEFPLFMEADYYSGGETKLRIVHTSTGVGTHTLNINLLELCLAGSSSASASASPSTSSSASSSNSPSQSPSSSVSSSASPSESSSESPSQSPSSSVSSSLSPSSSASPSESSSISASESSSDSPSQSPSQSPSSSESPSLSPSSSESPSNSPSVSASVSPSSSTSPSISSSTSPSSSDSPSASSSNSRSASSSVSPSVQIGVILGRNTNTNIMVGTRL